MSPEIESLKSQIESKKSEVEQFRDALEVLLNPPKFPPASGQLPLLDQLKEMLAQQKSEVERQQSIAAAKTVLSKAEGELVTMTERLERLELKEHFEEGKAAFAGVVENFNTAANNYLNAWQQLQETTAQYATTYQRSGVSRILNRDESQRTCFAQQLENGAIAVTPLNETRQAQRVAIGLEPTTLRRVV